MKPHAATAHAEKTNHCTVYDKCGPMVSVGSAMRDRVGESGGSLDKRST